MDYEIKPIPPDDYLRHREMMSQAFNRGRVQPPPPEGEVPVMRGHQGAYVDGMLQASLTLIPFDIHWGNGAMLPMGGIAGVATVPEARGRGLVAGLLRYTLERMRERGQVVSALYPFAFAFYRRHGWEWVGERHRLTVPLAELASYPEGKHVREIKAHSAREILKPVFDAYGGLYRGVFTSECHKWDDKLAVHDNRLSYVYLYQEPDRDPDGYLIWRYRSSGDIGDIREFVARTPAAYRGLLSIAHYLGTQCRKAEFDSLPADHSVWSHVMHHDLETRADPVFMARVVDVPAALESLSPDGDVPDGKMTIEVNDEIAPWNNGVWRVVSEGGRVTCSRVNDAADVSFDIQAFSQAYWGTPGVERLIRSGRVACTDPQAGRRLARILNGPPVWTADFF